MKEHISKCINDSIETKRMLLNVIGDIELMCNIVVNAYKNGGKLIIFGNGGSAADAQHIAAELVGLLDKHVNRPSMPALSLTVNTSILTAVSNDAGYEEVFSRQIEGMANKNDVIIGISTSGNSANILKAFEAAKKKGAKVIGWTGKDGGKMNSANLDFLFKVPSLHCGRIQESHIMVGHIMCDLIEKAMQSTAPKLVLLAGGKGTRLYPLTEDIPKPMINVAGKPILEHNINWAKSQGIKEIIICSGYLSNVIENYFKDGSNFGVHIKYFVEDKPLGTGGPLNLIKKELSNDFIVLNADEICKLDVNTLMAFHNDNKSDVTIVLQDTTHPEDSDLIETDSSKKITKFWLRPHVGIPPVKTSNAGMYVLSPKILEHIIDGNFSLEKQLFPFLHNKGYNVYGYYTTEYLEDAGTFERLKRIDLELKSY